MIINIEECAAGEIFGYSCYIYRCSSIYMDFGFFENFVICSSIYEGGYFKTARVAPKSCIVYITDYRPSDHICSVVWCSTGPDPSSRARKHHRHPQYLSEWSGTSYRCSKSVIYTIYDFGATRAVLK